MSSSPPEDMNATDASPHGLVARLQDRLAGARRSPGMMVTSVALVVAAGMVIAPARSEAAPLPLEPLEVVDPEVVDDDLNHFVVEVPAEQAAEQPAADADDEEDASDTPASRGVGGRGRDGRPTVDLDELRSLGREVVDVVSDGDDVHAVLGDGSRVAVGRSAGDPAAPARSRRAGRPARHPRQDVAVPTVPAAITELAALDEVAAVAPASGAHWSVSTSMDLETFEAAAEAAGAAGVEEDPILISYSDDTYSNWLWGLENAGGQSFPSNGGSVLGVADADADGVEARAAVHGTGVVVAVIDSGIQGSHEDLRPLWRNQGETSCTNGVDDDGNGYVDDCEGWDFYNGDNTIYDPGTGNDHGTHIASTIASVPNNGKGTAGLSPGVSIMNLKTFQNGGAWTTANAAAIRYAVDNGAHIINASWGSPPGVTRTQVAVLEDAIEYARLNGVLFVAAAGNNGANLDSQPIWPASFDLDNVITVGASRADDQRASFSNVSATAVDLFAPGEYIVAGVDGNSYRAMQGTSMAAPHVTAAGALVIAQDPDASVAQLRSALLSSVDVVPGLQGLAATGGRLNAARALGLNPDAGDPLTLTVAGADQVRPDEQADLDLTATVADPALAAGRTVELRATVLTAEGGETYAVTELPLTVNGTETATDERASVAISGTLPAGSPALTNGVTAHLGVTLPEGVYALAVEVVDAEEPTVAYGPAATVFLTVGEPTSEPPPTTVPPGGTTPTTHPSGGTTPTTQPSSGSTPTTQPPGGTTPTTQPSSGSTPTTQPSGGTTPTTQPSSGSTPTTQPSRTTTPTTTPDGGSTPTTQPSGGSTPTTQPSGGSTPVPPPPPPVEDDGIRITSLNPRSGATSGGTAVTISGDGFPEHPRVLFGGRAGDVLSRSATRVLVVTPGATAAGSVDVTVGDHVGNDVTMADGFTYLGDATTTPTTAPPDGGTTPTTSPGGTTTPTTAPADGTTSTTTATGGTSPSGGRSRLGTSGAPISRRGLKLVKVTNSPVSAPVSTWASLSCQSATCAGTVSR